MMKRKAKYVVWVSNEKQNGQPSVVYTRGDITVKRDANERRWRYDMLPTKRCYKIQLCYAIQ